MGATLITSDIAVQPAEIVNLDLVFSIRKLDNGNKPSIVFDNQSANSNWQPITWKYDTTVNRDADFALIRSKYVASVNEVQ